MKAAKKIAAACSKLRAVEEIRDGGMVSVKNLADYLERAKTPDVELTLFLLSCAQTKLALMREVLEGLR